MNIFFNMKYNFKRKIILLSSPFLLLTLTGCEKEENISSFSLITSEQEYYTNMYDLENMEINDILREISKSNDLYKTDEVLFYNAKNEKVKNIRENYLNAIDSNFYNNVNKAYKDYIEYKDYFLLNYSEEFNIQLKELFGFYSGYLYSYKNNNSYEVYSYYEKINKKINEISINNILENKFGNNDYSKVNLSDNSLLCNLIRNGDCDVNYKVKYLYEILFQNYEFLNNNLKQTDINSFDILYRKTTNEESNEKELEYTYRMDSNGILWNE